MCGIAGLLARSNVSPSRLSDGCGRMVASLVHRGPDAGGVWTDPAAGIALGHRRLAILDLSEAGAQPMASRSGRFVIVFNGEIYNHLDLRADLAREGQASDWHGHSDTETLLACVEAWGLPRTLERVSGMFAFGLWDRREGTLSLARDRLGEKPLYFAARNGAVLFASELKALRAAGELDLEIDREAAALFFRFDYVPDGRTIYTGVRKLPPGTWITATREDFGSAEPRSYWSVSEVALRNAGRRVPMSMDEAASAFETLFGRVVRAQMISDAPLGTFLSGGIDSSLVTALMAAGAGQKVKSISIGFGDPRFNEAVHARAVAEHLGTDHTELVVTEQDALDVVPRLARIFDEPFADSSQIPTVLLAQLARTRVTVAMSGDGGDELFGGYNRYLFAPKLWDRYARIPAQLRPLASALIARAPQDPDSLLGRAVATVAARAGLHGSLARKAARYGRVLAGSTRFGQVYGKLVEDWPRDTSPVLGDGGPDTFLDREDAWPPLPSREETMMAVDAMTYLPDDILVKVDRSAMAASLETRAPFLDPSIVDFAWSLPLALKIGPGGGKLILRHVLDRYVPRRLIDRPKQGFAVPLDDWLRGPLRDWAESLLSVRALTGPGLLDPGLIRSAWADHLAGRRQLGSRLWAVLMFQAWFAEAAASTRAPMIAPEAVPLPAL